MNYRGASGKSLRTKTKNDYLMKKLFFTCNIHCIPHLFLFLQQEQIFKSSKWGRLGDLVVGCPVDQIMVISGNVSRTSLIHVFKIHLTNILNLLSKVTQDLILKGRSENSMISVVVKK